MDIPVQPGDVLAQPSRARLFSLLAEVRRPAGTEELARQLGMHPNGVRMHLERMAEAGLLTREATRQARGRPRDMWSVAPGARPGGDPPSAYAELGRWLTRLIGSRKTSPRAVEAAGREIGRGLAPADDARPVEERMFATLASLGFAPERTGDAGEADLTYRLGNCPYRDAVREDQAVVCGLHRGITRGLLDELAPETRLAGFVPRDPYEAGCLIELRGGLTADRPAAPPA
jgi:predicted ArsR family transcriptional regulator